MAPRHPGSPPLQTTHDSVDLLRGHPRRDGSVRSVQHQPPDAAGLPDARHLLRAAAGHRALLPALNLRGGHAAVVIVGLGDAVGDLQSGGRTQRVCLCARKRCAHVFKRSSSHSPATAQAITRRYSAPALLPNHSITTLRCKRTGRIGPMRAGRRLPVHLNSGMFRARPWPRRVQ